MPLVNYKDLCLDANDMVPTTEFWGRALGLDVVPDDDGSGEVHLEGSTPRHMVLPCIVPEPKTVKNRVHLDVWSATEVLEGATRLSAPGEFGWTTQADPEGNELCTFVTDDLPTYRLKSIGVDTTADHHAIARWWADVWGGTLVHDPSGYSYLEDIPGVPFESFDFVPVPEPKTVKNRIHWDVTLIDGAEVTDLVGVGATVLRGPTDEDPWTVMADPEGNEFCVFEPSA